MLLLRCRTVELRRTAHRTRLNLTVKIDPTDVLQQHPPFHGVHLVTHAHGAGTEVQVHAVQGVGHGVHGVDHKLHLAFLFVLRISTDPLIAWQVGKDSEEQLGEVGAESGRRPLTCAFPPTELVLYTRAGQLTFEVVFPEFGEPDVPSVVLERSRGEILVET